MGRKSNYPNCPFCPLGQFSCFLDVCGGEHPLWIRVWQGDTSIECNVNDGHRNRKPKGNSIRQNFAISILTFSNTTPTQKRVYVFKETSMRVNVHLRPPNTYYVENPNMSDGKITHEASIKLQFNIQLQKKFERMENIRKEGSFTGMISLKGF